MAPRRVIGMILGNRGGALASALVLGLVWACPAPAQIVLGGRAVPRIGFYSGLAELYSGDYRDAARQFRSELTGGGTIKSTQGRWVDSICQYAMLGECFYQMGQYDHAVEQFEAALNLALVYSDWMLRVQFPSEIRPDTNLARRAAPWGRSSRAFEIGSFPNSMLVAQGQIDQYDVLRQGGVVQQPVFYSVNVQEILRCTALAMRRRGELLGPVASHDTLADELVGALSRRPVPPNHWSEAWIDFELGMAQASAGRLGDAQKSLVRSLLVGGRFDHPLTSMALLELGRIAVTAGDLAAAAKFFADAGSSAFFFGNIGDLEEAHWRAHQARIMQGSTAANPGLALAARWAQSKRYRQLQAQLTLLSAETAALGGDASAARGLLGVAGGLLGRRDMGRGLLGARRDYLAALIQTQLDRPEAAGKALQTALAFQKNSSKWLYQIRMANRRYADRSVTPRIALELYGELLREPTAKDWAADPLEALSVLMVPHRSAYERWFEAALSRKEIDRAMEIADRTRRQDFFSSLPLGGRLLALRSILEAPLEQVGRDAELQRQDLLLRYPKYKELHRRANDLHARLAEGPLVPAAAEDVTRRRSLWRELAEVSAEQEQLLRKMALGHGPSRLVFPPARSAKEIRDGLPDRHAMLMFFAHGEQIDAFVFTRDDYQAWKLSAPASLRKNVTLFLRDLGNHDANRQLSVASLAGSEWRQSGAKIKELLLKGSNIDLTRGVDQWVIVPDSFLWYLPFEAIPVGEPAEPLIRRVRVRYAPTAGLTLAPTARPGTGGKTAVVVGKLFPRDDPAVAEEQYQRLRKVVPNLQPLRPPLPAPSGNLATLLGSLIVLDDIEPAGPYAWTPIPLDLVARDGALDRWMALPWGGPKQVILPGYHTAAENALRRRGTMEPGREMFFSLCGLMATGARTILLSRWRTGGETSYGLVREFIQELPHSPASEAWQRSVQLAAVARINPDREPRVRRGKEVDLPAASHPFFWAGYLLVDTGADPSPSADGKQ